MTVFSRNFFLLGWLGVLAGLGWLAIVALGEARAIPGPERFAVERVIGSRLPLGDASRAVLRVRNSGKFPTLFTLVDTPPDALGPEDCMRSWDGDCATAQPSWTSCKPCQPLTWKARP